ncbi:predicted protein [Chaetomium globosum CBS 148.51]|uniref:Homeobox domain-containing protein n=1 Tax=Chaetomium globosum (strain ATCC 6205 / CBS 148.51 / DSM 1962 / NBRC 6347 / NRRL 1970) TaxID=306901 RepID=Q2H8X0_CHAGB|nr:uncharacterized protein CHGG_03334 [Chaetomium globosum CBS 148.51]EAQ91399.1 predicted protein [Chaetomium globosum CBS 148.51]
MYQYNGCPPAAQKAVLSISEMLNPAAPVSHHSARYGAASSPGAWSPSDAAPSPSNYTYSSQPERTGWEYHPSAAAWESDPAPRRYPATPTTRLPPISVPPSEGPAGGYAGDGHRNSHSSWGGGSGASSPRVFGSFTPVEGARQQHLPTGGGLARGERETSLSTLDGSEGPAKASGKTRQNFPGPVTKVFNEWAEKRILVNDDRCRFTKSEMVTIASVTDVELKQVENWYTNHRRRGFPQQMIDVLHREAKAVERKYREADQLAAQQQQEGTATPGEVLRAQAEAVRAAGAPGRSPGSGNRRRGKGWRR